MDYLGGVVKIRNLDRKDHWATPKDFYDKLNEEFCFDFDPCPLHADFDGLDPSFIWWGESIFINPPYSQKLKESFVQRALEESKKGKTCVLLLPVSTQTFALLKLKGNIQTKKRHKEEKKCLEIL